MIEITNISQLNNLPNGNQIIGPLKEMNKATIRIWGSNNILYIGSDCILENSTLEFKGDNSVIFLAGGNFKHCLNVTVHNNNVFFMGRHNHMFKPVTAVVSEEKNVFIGDYCLFSRNIWIRNSDSHLIYSTENNQRINRAKSIFIGDHIWIGQSAMILKGTQIDSGAVIGAMSLLSGKKIPHNSSWGGNPAKLVRENVFWDRTCSHAFTEAENKASMDYENFQRKHRIDPDIDYPDSWSYTYNEKECIEFAEIERKLSKLKGMDAVNYLKKIDNNRAKNRFVHTQRPTKTNWLNGLLSLL